MKVVLRVTAGPMAGREFAFAEPDRFLFGRAADARCSLPDDPFVSNHHFLVVVAPQGVSLHELGSKNGTFVNDVRYGGRKPPAEGVRQAPPDECDVPLRDGDRISVGDTVFEVGIQRDESSVRMPSFSDESVSVDAAAVIAEPGTDADDEERPTVPPRTPPFAQEDASLLFADVSPMHPDAPALDATPARPAAPGPRPPAPGTPARPGPGRPGPARPGPGQPGPVRPRPGQAGQPVGKPVAPGPPGPGPQAGRGAAIPPGKGPPRPARPAPGAGPPRPGGAPRPAPRPAPQPEPAPPSSSASASGSSSADEGMNALARLLAEAAERREGPKLPRYEVVRLLGEGGMGKVYLARDEASGEQVAIKVILPHGSVSAQALELFQRETDLTRQLQHPNIVRYIDGGCARGTFFLVLEFVDGCDLATLAERQGGVLPLELIGPLMVGALRGLGHAHTAELEAVITEQGRAVRRKFSGLVHRDLKPENVLVAELPGGVRIPKIADLGLAKVYGSAGLSDFTAPDAVAGTPLYWPREQLTDYRYLKPAADVFAMGTILYLLLSGHLPREGLDKRRLSFHRLCAVILREPTIPILERMPALHPEVARVVDTALQDDPAARYAEAAAMAAALRRALVRAGIELRSRRL
ncbi:MAG: protein kinase [Planctomycetota bacterium]